MWWKMPFIAHLGQLLPLNVILAASVDNVNMTRYTWRNFTAQTSKSNIAQHSAIPGWLCWATQENALDCKCKDSSSSPLNGQEISTSAFLRQYYSELVSYVIWVRLSDSETHVKKLQKEENIFWSTLLPRSTWICVQNGLALHCYSSSGDPWQQTMLWENKFPLEVFQNDISVVVCFDEPIGLVSVVLPYVNKCLE